MMKVYNGRGQLIASLLIAIPCFYYVEFVDLSCVYVLDGYNIVQLQVVVTLGRMYDDNVHA
jgi:hypothetical protein